MDAVYKFDVAGFINTDQFGGYKQAGNNILYASSTSGSIVVGNGGRVLLTNPAVTSSVSVGSGALNSLTLSGINNTALGFSSLVVNTTGARNAAVGFNTLVSNTTGGLNIAMGEQALAQNTTGSNNVALGYQASFRNNSATNTVAIGMQAALGNAAGYNNQGGTVVGYAAGSSFQTGSNYNTLVGYQAGYDITTGTNNTILGQFLATGTGVTGGSNNILIGKGVRSGLTVGGSNQLNIGNLLFGTSVAADATLSTGNVGIGTSTPNQKLTLFAAAADAAIEFSTVSGTAEKWTVGIDDSDAAKFKISSSSALGTSDRFVINGNGYVGIGDSTPAALLSVGSGDLFTVNSSGVISSSNNLTPNAVFSTGQADEECLTYEATGTTFEWQTCGTGYLASTDIDTSSELDTIVGDNTGSGALVFGTSPTFTTYANFGSAGVRLSDDGDGGLTFLGLGNGNDEDLKLDLDNTANTGVFTSSTGLTQLTFTGIGINTTSGTGYSMFGTKYFYASTTNDSISIGENAGRLFNGGALYNVALGFEAGYTATSSDYNTYIGYRSGYAGTSASTNVAIGYEALLTSTSSSGNVAIGYRALRSLNGSGVNGAGLVAIGYEALTSNTSGHLNVAIGQAALRSNTSGSQNIGIGYGAGYWNTTGFDNIFIGQETGSGVVAGSTGSNNTAVGRLAMTGYSSGGGNSAFGRSALGNNKTGSNNTTLGYLASTYNGSATNTVSVGAYAAYGSGVSYSNQGSTVVGFQSGYSFQTGSHYNTLIGYNAGYNVTTGTYNTMLGYFGTTGGVTTGSNNILIGQDVRSGLTVGSSNQLNVGNLLYGTGLGSGTTLSTGKIGIGTSTPNQKLSIFADAADAAIEFSTVSGTAEKWTVGIDDSDAAKFKISSSSALGTNDRFVIDGNGYIGIGDSSPTALLTVGSGDLFTVNSSGVISSSNNLTPNTIFSTGQADEECLTYEATGATFEWQTCGTGYLASTDIDTSSELAGILTDETGTGRSVFSISPAFSGTPTFAALTATSTLTLSGTAANIALGSNFISTGGADEGISVGASGNVTISGTLGVTGGLTIDATTETNIESAIDTLANLTSASALATVGTITSGTWQGTVIDITRGGLGAAFTDPNADQLMFWDDSLGAITGITSIVGGSISGTTLTIAVGAGEITDDSITFADINMTAAIGSDPAFAVNDTFFGSTGIIFEGGTADAFEGLLTSAVATSDKTWTLPNTTGTLITNGDTGTVTNTMLAGSIAASKLVGTDIVTVGTITSGTWTAGVISSTYLDTGVLLATELDTCAEFAALGVIETGTCGSLVLSVSPAITGTLDVEASDFSGLLTMSGSAANIALGSNYLSGDGGDEGIFVDASGNVGVGMDAVYKFDVAGFINTDQFGGYKQAGNTILYASSTNNSMFAGIGAGASFVASSSNRFSNAFGRLTLSSASMSGSFNNGFGYGALLANTTGLANNAFGHAALDAVTTGAYNTGVGHTALQNITTTSFNTAIGSFSQYLATANNNTSIGYQSLYSATGGNNVAVGFQALDSLTASGGTTNTAIGYAAGDTLYGSTKNTFLGSNADVITNSSSTITNSTAVGADVTLYNSNTVILGNGADVGIGTSTPNQRLTIFKSAADAAIEFSTVSGANEKWTIGVDDSDAAKFKISSSSALGTNDRFVINGNGSVGIGDSTPDYFFDVAGTAGFDGNLTMTGSTANIILGSNYLSGDGGDEGVFVDASGNVGVGMDAVYKFDVAGFINTDMFSAYKQNGTNILYASSTNSATVVGNGGRTLLTSAAVTGSVSVGSGALNSLTLSGVDNTAIGFAALAVNTTGARNAAIGFNALVNNTTGSLNIAMGEQALAQNTTGANNVALGYQASYRNNSATNTVAVGEQAGLGNAAGYSNQGGTVVGYGAGHSFQTGSHYNTLIGYQAGYDITVGTYNTILGQFTTTGAGVTTGSNNILVGKGVRSGLTVGGSDQLNIGNLLFGTSVAADTTLSTGKVGIGTSTPNQKLSIFASAADAAIEFSTVTGTAEKWTVGIDDSASANFKISSSSALGTNDRLIINGSGGSTFNADYATNYVSYFFNDGNNANRYGLKVQAGADDGTGTTYYLDAYDGDGGQVGYLANTSGTFAVTDISDRRTKVNITETEIVNATDVITALRVVDFNRRADPDGPRITGFIAQEVEAVFPFAVTENPKTGYLGVMKDAFVPLLVKGAQEQQATIREQGITLASLSESLLSTISSVADLEAAVSTGLSENYQTTGVELEAGDIVTLATSSDATITRASYGDTLFGVIATNPGLTLGADMPDAKPVALTGRASVKVNMEGGDIKVGDRITLSSEAGIGTKATSTARVLGTALEDADEAGTIVIFVEPSTYFTLDSEAKLASLFTPIEANQEDTLWSRITTLASNFVDGVLSVTGLKTDRIDIQDELCVDDVCINADDLRTLLDKSSEEDPPAPDPEPPVIDPESTPEPAPEPIPESEPPPEPTPEPAS
jgi:hypothetical protein